MGRKGHAEQWLTKDGLDWIEGWVRNGLLMREVAENMGISEASLYRWRNRFPAIDAAIRAGEAPCNYRVESAMYKAATGHTQVVRKPIKIRETIESKGKGKKTIERIEYAEEEVYIPPDPKAQIYWLQNRDPEHWSREQRVDLTVSAAEGAQIMREIEERLNGEGPGSGEA